MITFFTIVLDGMPWICHHYPVFCQLNIPWRWIVVEGVAENVKCTSWCSKIKPRLSNDGTDEYLSFLCSKDNRVTHSSSGLWEGKVQMCNAALSLIQEPCLLWQVDADELWTPKQIEYVFETFRENPHHNAAWFMCRYFVGPDRYIKPELGVYGNHTAYEWRRVWRFEPKMRFESHEPPIISPIRLTVLDQRFWPKTVVFDHMAYATRKQMEFRAQYYAGPSNPNAHLWRNCVEGWERLQAVTEFPIKLKDYFPWVDDKATVILA